MLTQMPVAVPGDDPAHRMNGAADLFLYDDPEAITSPLQRSMHASQPQRQLNVSPDNYQKALDEIIASLPALTASDEPPRRNVPEQRAETLTRPAILSVTTEEDILALADILTPSNDGDDDDELPQPAMFRPGYLKRPVVSTAHLSSGFPAPATAATSPSTPRSGSESLYSDDHSHHFHLTPSSSSISSSQSYLSPVSRPRYLSDTPSLTNSDAFSSPTLSTPPLSRAPSFPQLQSPPASPLSQSFLHTPVDPLSPGPGLGVIRESNYSQDALTLGGAAVRDHHSFVIEETSRERDLKDPTMLARRGLPELEISTFSIDTVRPSMNPFKGTSDDIGGGGGGSPQPAKGGKTFSRLFKSSSRHADSSVPPSPLPGDLKAAKEEEKRRQKQLAKERRERLARDFQAKARGYGADTESITSSERRRRAKAPWEEESGGVYNSLSFV
jgi:hypothetical protein